MKTKRTTPKMSGLVVAALRNLRDAHGSTAKEIMKYIMAEYNASEAVVQRQLKTALKRGVEYGILKKTSAGYSLNTDAEVITPLDSAPVDSCGRSACKPKRRACNTCPKKRKRNPCCPKKRKRSSCKKRRKKNPCKSCAARGEKGDCSAEPVQLVREGTPTFDEDVNNRTDKASLDGYEQDQDMKHRSRSNSRTKDGRNNKSRSQSLARSRYSCSDNDEDHQDDD